MMLLLERREGRPAIMKNLFLGVALVVFCPGVALAEVESGLQEPNQAIIVTGAGLPLPPGTPAYGSVTIGRERLTDDASGRVENVLRDVAGFAQFRRSDSRSANPTAQGITRSEEHTSELQSLMRTSYAAFCLKKKTQNTTHNYN